MRGGLQLALVLGGALLAPAVALGQAAPPQPAATPPGTPDALPLWPEGAPGAPADVPPASPPKVRIAANGEHVISGVHVPTITPYLADEARATGCGVIIMPGGGHRELWSDHEGHNLARRLRDSGVSAFVVIYRLASEQGSTYTVDDHALADVQRAIRTVRARAAEWRVQPDRVGVLGFSAGGELAALAAMRGGTGDAASTDPIEQQSSRPDFQALIYPGRSNRFEVAPGMPPLFIVCGYKDRDDIAKGMASLYLKYKEAGVPAELHIYAEAGHGFGLRTGETGAVGRWPDRLMDWLRDRRLLDTP